ncbi:MAG: hypothetical protein Q4D77_09010 [Peptostreptococcaceae bacterium]|nr:hypothetical protein [Peptostreptococcaceae bacterium]
MDIKRNIMISRSDFALISSYAKKAGLSFSEAISQAAVAYIDEENQHIHPTKDLDDEFLSLGDPFATKN